MVLKALAHRLVDVRPRKPLIAFLNSYAVVHSAKWLDVVGGLAFATALVSLELWACTDGHGSPSRLPSRSLIDELLLEDVELAVPTLVRVGFIGSARRAIVLVLRRLRLEWLLVSHDAEDVVVVVVAGV